MTIYFSSDFHLSHYKIIQYCNRPFASIAEMNDTIIKNFNSIITPNDYLYHLGDFCMGGKYEYVASLVRRLNGRKIFLTGNHDNTKHLIQLQNDNLIENWHDVLGIFINKQYIWLSHYPHLSWNKSFHGSWHFFGHVHNKNVKGISGPAINVGVDVWNFMPVSFDMAKNKIDQIKETKDI